MHILLMWLLRLLVVAYVVALVVLVIGALGLFGQPRDPLSGVFLIPLGFPWFMIGDTFSARVRPWIAAVAPIVNIAILAWAAHRVGGPAQRKGRT